MVMILPSKITKRQANSMSDRVAFFFRFPKRKQSHVLVGGGFGSVLRRFLRLRNLLDRGYVLLERNRVLLGAPLQIGRVTISSSVGEWGRVVCGGEELVAVSSAR
ncbi:hypothetical protein C2E25_14850 [Geothermobacter hydrogeniphilus]|uniref:Uncharacterized protein n=1 Tax=Geothermobacter hydrogeniphilus TaxID=1969733 RepID=A0A2K2H6T9_9BACT|nr:hypothetical protein C2E25_14850 [Geothermobacter hydrogeniphilus]